MDKDNYISLFQLARRYMKNMDGATAIEQGLVGSMVAIALLFASKKMGNPVKDNPDFGQISAIIATPAEPLKTCDATLAAKDAPPTKLRQRSNPQEARTTPRPPQDPCADPNTTQSETR